MGPVQNTARLIREAPGVARALRAAAGSDPGSHREVNEDRFHCDATHGVFFVIDGVGGQAAGGRAADIAVAAIRSRLERGGATAAERITDAIAAANNEVFRAAIARPEWHGMACVLTVVVVEDDRAIVGHVGDTRLYKLTRDGIVKITRDHSPVGEREDARQISELEAMQHPRRNEVYRDVGSELHDPADPDFIDLYEASFEPGAALLLCSDGLSDAIPSARIRELATRFAGEPQRVVPALIDAANAAGGKDNITAVYVEGEQFAELRTVEQSAPPRRAVRAAVVGLLALVVALAVAAWRPDWRLGLQRRLVPVLATGPTVVVDAHGSIADALETAAAGATVLVEPGEYHERLTLRSGVRVVSRVPRGATIRLPGGASEADPAVVAAEIRDAEFAGFRIVGDAASPLGTGILVRDANLSIVDVEISGASSVALEIGGVCRPNVVASDIRDNPGAALAIRAGAAPRIMHNVFIRNGLSTAASGTIAIDGSAEPDMSGNIFHGIGRASFSALPEAVRSAIIRDNWFPEADTARPDVRTPRGRSTRP
jgi:PPM family protein phosphatase